MARNRNNLYIAWRIAGRRARPTNLTDNPPTRGGKRGATQRRCETANESKAGNFPRI